MSPDKPILEDVAAVVVTYNPDQRFPKSAVEVARQVHKIIIVDNGSNLPALRMVREVASSLRAELVENETNLGVAAALNQGVRRALYHGCAWILTMDQDSEPEPDMVEKLIDAYCNHPRRETVALVAPVIVDRDSGRSELARLCDGTESVDVVAAITSGSLMATQLLASAGLFREDLFIDCVDVEYCLRLRRTGHEIIVACNAKLFHNLGTPTYHRVLWKSRAVTSNHAPVRRYYIARNRLLTIKEYVLREPMWATGELVVLLKEAVKMLLFEDDRKNKAKFFVRGVIDAVLNRTGEFPGKRDAEGTAVKSMPDA